jgi:glutathione S-transferase
MLRLYDSRLSGNAWKVRILLTQLGIPFERVTLDLAKGAAAEPAFRAKSRFARVPVLELEDGRTIVESAAIMLYLAEGSSLLPDDRYLRAEVTSWLTFEQADLLRALALPHASLAGRQPLLYRRYWRVRICVDGAAGRLRHG